VSDEDDQAPALDLRARVLTAPAYQERIELLLDPYALTRQHRHDPRKLLLIQDGLGQILRSFQEKKREFDTETDDLGVAVTRRSMKVVYSIGDGMAWRSLRYDRLSIGQLAAKSRIGFLDSTFQEVIELAAHIVADSGKIVLVNDLNTVLRHGDLTIIGENAARIHEHKSGKASRRDVRAKRQRIKLEEVLSFLNRGTQTTDGRTELLLRMDLPASTYLPQVGEVLHQASQEGYARAQLSDCLAVEAFDLRHQRPREGQRPFVDRKYVLPFSNLELFVTLPPRIAPYSIFPFDDRTCFDLMTGQVLLRAYLDVQALQSRFAKVDLALSFPTDEHAMREYAEAPIYERKKRMAELRFSVRDAKPSMILALTPDLLGTIFIEFFHEDTFVSAIRKVFEEVGPQYDEGARFYMGLTADANLWD
jgi:hypothetical protein